MQYQELCELFCKLTPKAKYRIVCHYVLGLPISQLARIENVSKQAVHTTFVKANNKLKKINDHNEIIAAMQEIFVERL